MKHYILLLISLFIPIAIPSYAFAHNESYEGTTDNIARANLFYSYDEIVQVTRNQNRTHFFVLFNPDQAECFVQLHDLAEQWVSTCHDWHACSTNILLLCPTGINILIYPPQPDPMLAKIEAFQKKFADASLPTSGSWLIVVEISPDQEKICDMHELILPSPEAHHQCDMN